MHLQHIVLDTPAQRKWVNDVEMLEQARHVGQGCKAVGVKVAITHLQHIVLDSPAQRKWVNDVEMLEQDRHVGQGC